MDLQFTLVLILFALSAVITAVLTVVSWRTWKTGIAPYFSLLMGAATLWTLGNIGEIMSTGLSQRYFFICLEYPGIVTVPVAWFFIVLQYTGHSRILTKKTVPLFFIVPAISVLLVLTNPLHYLYYSGFSAITEYGTVIWVSLHGPLFWIHAGYSYALSVFGLGLVISYFLTASLIYRRQVLLLLLACAIPVAANMAYVFSIGPFPGQDFTPLMFTLSGIIVAFGILRYRLFSLMPVAYSQVFKTITDGVVVTTPDGRIVDVNPSAERILSHPARDLISRHTDEFFPSGVSFGDLCGKRWENDPAEIMIPKEEERMYFETYCAPLSRGFPERNGYLLILRDITQRKQAETALESAHKKLSLMAGITRHDILNQITAFNCYLELSATLATTPEQAEYIKKEKKSIGIIQQQIEFTRQYRNLGVEVPQWQAIDRLVPLVVSPMDKGAVTVAIRIPPCEVYADPMLEKVFFNLITNALKYGETLTRVTITGEPDKENFRIVCEDDGIGIAAGDKPYLFSRGFGKNTGLGLFLSREILAITGITITEDSEPGKGARFVIVVPAEAWRIPGP